MNYDHHYYRDIAVLAFPETTNGIVAANAVLNLTTKLDADGKLNWEVPAGQWIIQRIGHTTTGSSTRPPVKGGNGLECDKLSREAMDVQFTNMMGKLIAEVGPLAGKTLVATHIDSWEVGSQNWTPKFREEFEKRRGYDPLPYLPDVTGHATASSAPSAIRRSPARFRWDFDQTISELLAENYVGRLAELAHEHGLRLTLEGYDLPFGDEATYTARADEPMSEFWATGAKPKRSEGAANGVGRACHGRKNCRRGSVHLGRQRTMEDSLRRPSRRWAIMNFPKASTGLSFTATRSSLISTVSRARRWGRGDCTTSARKPGGKCPPRGTNILPAASIMLRQGMFVADLCYLRPQLPNQTYFTPDPPPCRLVTNTMNAARKR